MFLNQRFILLFLNFSLTFLFNISLWRPSHHICFPFFSFFNHCSCWIWLSNWWLLIVFIAYRSCLRIESPELGPFVWTVVSLIHHLSLTDVMLRKFDLLCVIRSRAYLTLRLIDVLRISYCISTHFKNIFIFLYWCTFLRKFHFIFMWSLKLCHLQLSFAIINTNNEW